MQLLLPGEDASHYEELLAQFQQDFAPKDVAQAAMVRDLVNLTWKQLRVERMQHTILLSAMGSPVTESELQHKADFNCTNEQFKRIGRVDDDDLEEQAKVIGPLLAFLEDFQHDRTSVGLQTFKKRWPTDYQEMKDDFDGQFNYERPFEDVVLTATTSSPSGGRVNYIGQYLSPIIWHYKSVVWVYEKRAEIQQAQQTVKAKRVMECMQGRFSSRVFDDLQRGFYRTLNELRRHQSWRRSQMVVDVTMAPQLAVTPYANP